MQFMKFKWMSNIETCSLKYCAITDWISLCTNQNMIETDQMTKGSSWRFILIFFLVSILFDFDMIENNT